MITRLPPVISIDISTSVLEGDDVKVTLTRSFATNEVSSVTISTSATLSATASPKGTPDADRTAADFWEKLDKEVIFQSGDTTTTINIHTVDNKLFENNELITIRLSNPVNASIGVAQGTVTIIDNDNIPGIEVPVGGMVGNNFSETLDGTADTDFIHGRGGNDTINGFGGNDTLTRWQRC